MAMNASVAFQTMPGHFRHVRQGNDPREKRKQGAQGSGPADAELARAPNHKDKGQKKDQRRNDRHAEIVLPRCRIRPLRPESRHPL